MDNTTKKNCIAWCIVLLIEAIILKLKKSMHLWIYIALPIIAGLVFAEIRLPKQKKNKRNLK